MWSTITDFLGTTFISLPFLTWIIIAIILIIYIRVNYFGKKNNKEKSEDTTTNKVDDVPKESIEEVKKEKPKTKRKWNFSLFGWIKFGWLKELTWDKIFVQFIVPIIIIIGGVLWYYGEISFSTKEVVWMVIISVVVIIFSTRSRGFRLLVSWGSAITLFALICMWFSSLNLQGDPAPIYIKTANIQVEHSFDDVSTYDAEYDVKNPRWTKFIIDVDNTNLDQLDSNFIYIPDNSWLEISAEGKHYFIGKSTLYKNDGDTYCGPEGATFNVAILKGNKVDLDKPHLPHPDNYVLINGPYAALIGKIGKKGEVFLIGKHRRIFIKEGGILKLSTNLKWVNPPSGDYKFNWKPSSGIFHIKFSISPNVLRG